MRQLPRTITALITPFKEGEIDLELFRNHLLFQIEQGIKGVLVLGSTGESFSLTTEEKKTVVDQTVSWAKHSCFVIVNVTENCTKHMVETALLAEDLGADCLLLAPPPYSKPEEEGLYAHFMSLAEKVELPIILYNHPGRTGVNLSLSLMKRLLQESKFVGLKEASMDLVEINEKIITLKSLRQEFMIYSGNDILTYPTLSLGADGCIAVLSNLYPKKMAQLVEFAKEGNMIEANRLHCQLFPLMQDLNLETNPIPVKMALNFLKQTGGEYRLPLTEMHPQKKKQLLTTLKTFENTLV